MTNEVGVARIAERRTILERAMSLPLPDAVFGIVHYNSHRRTAGPPPYCEPIPSSALQASGSQDEIEKWINKVIALLDAAYLVGDALLRKDGSYESTRVQFEIEHPGFNPDTYDEAVSYGCFMAR